MVKGEGSGVGAPTTATQEPPNAPTTHTHTWNACHIDHKSTHKGNNNKGRGNTQRHIKKKHQRRSSAG